MGYRDIYEYVEARGAVPIKKIEEVFDISPNKILDLIRPLIISKKLTLQKDFLKYTAEDSQEEIPE